MVETNWTFFWSGFGLVLVSLVGSVCFCFFCGEPCFGLVWLVLSFRSVLTGNPRGPLLVGVKQLVEFGLVLFFSNPSFGFVVGLFG